jgi:secondary thiamine-phosphate synthase enzyme
LDNLAPESALYAHGYEGADDMPAHIKTVLVGSQVTIPITSGRLGFGAWQGLYLCEHRNHGGRRRLIVTVWGEIR